MRIQKCFRLTLLLGLGSLVFSSLAMAQFTASREAADAAKVVARVDGKDITLGQVREILQNAPPVLAQQFQSAPKAALTEWFVSEYLGSIGAERKLDERSPLKEQLEALRMTVLASAAVNDVRDGYAVSPEMIEAYYNEHQAEFTESEIKAIFLRFRPEVQSTGTGADAVRNAAQAALAGAATQRTETETLTLARDIVKQLREGGDFAELAMKYSDDMISRQQGGKFGQTVSAANGNLPQDFRNAVLKLSQDEISDPIRQSTGFYIVQVISKEARELRQVREPIVQAIRQDYLVKFLDDLRVRFNAEVVDQSFFTNPGPALQGR